MPARSATFDMLTERTPSCKGYLGLSPLEAGRGRLVVHKRVVDPTDPNRRFERQGFTFQLVDAQDQPVGAPFSTDSTGRGIFDGELSIGETYTLRETSSPIPNVAPVTQTFVMDKANSARVRLRIESCHVYVPKTSE